MSQYKPISTIVHATRILRLLSKGSDNLSMISKELDLNIATVHRTLKTLEFTELAIQDPITRRYYLGPLISKLSSDPVTGHHDLVLLTREYLEHLCDFSGETIGILIRIGTKRILIDEVPSPHPIRFFGGKGYSGPVYADAPGKVLLSQLSDKDLNFLLNKIKLSPIGSETTIDKELYKKELLNVRTNGFATSMGETVDGAAAIAVPIQNYLIPVALGLTGPEGRVLPKLDSYISELKRIAKEISSQLKEVNTLSRQHFDEQS